jgi:predicted esterase
MTRRWGCASSSASALLIALASILPSACGQGWVESPDPPPSPPAAAFKLSPEDDRFLEELSKRSFLFFWEQVDPKIGIVRDRSRTDGSPSSPNHEKVGSIASVGFGLTGLCIAAERGWVPRADVLERTRTTLRTFAERLFHDHGWFYHWLNVHTGEREWKSEGSSIDTALLLGGVLSVRQCFKDDPEIVRLATTIYERVDFQWMRNGHETLLSHGWRPESGPIVHRWDAYSEAMILYVLGLASPTHPLPPASWRAWVRPVLEWDGLRYVTHVPPLFIHQYSHAWVDFRAWRDPEPPHDWFENAAIATRANRQFCLSLQTEFPGYTATLWGITASDTRNGYRAWGGPPRDPAVDGSIVPCAAAGSLMLTPEITVPAVREMHDRFGDKLFGRYGFADAFHPTDGWINPDVIGIDLGITLLSAENLRTGRVWQWFMANPEIGAGLRRAGFVPAKEWKAPARADDGRAEFRLVPQPDGKGLGEARAALRTLPASLADAFEARTFTAPDGATLGYRLLRPVSSVPRAPLIVVLHGSGEIGTDNRKQLTTLPLALARDDTRRAFPAFVLVPQFPARSVEYSGPAEGDRRVSEATPLLGTLLALIDELLRTLPIDRARVYGIGFSMGASTLWQAMHARPDLFVAGIPIGGVPNPAHAMTLAKTPIWVVHGGRDNVNPMRHARAIYRPLVDAGGRVRFWEIDFLQHEVPPWLLVSDAFPRWLFEQRK